MKKITAIILLIFALGRADAVLAQACSCGGAPLLGSLEFPTTPAGSWQVGLTYEYNSISDVVSESTVLADDTRRRKVHAGLLEISYGLTSRFTLSTALTLLQQERTTNTAGSLSERLRTRGIGDGVFLLKFDLLPYSVSTFRQVAVGGGVKLPFGKSDLTANGLLLAADMQPGTGSTDGVLWGYFFQGFNRIAPLSVQTSVTYRFTGENDRFGGNNGGYRFGNELIASVGLNARPSTLFDYTLALRYRRVGPSRFIGNDLPNSGGKWLDLAPGINLNLSPSMAVRVAGQVPVYRKLDGTQLTTDYVLSLSLFYSITKSQSVIGL